MGHAIFGILFLALIESPWMDFIKNCGCCERALPRQSDQEMDEDVLDEEDRIANQVKGVANIKESAEKDFFPDLRGGLKLTRHLLRTQL